MRPLQWPCFCWSCTSSLYHNDWLKYILDMDIQSCNYNMDNSSRGSKLFKDLLLSIFLYSLNACTFMCIKWTIMYLMWTHSWCILFLMPRGRGTDRPLGSLIIPIAFWGKRDCLLVTNTIHPSMYPTVLWLWQSVVVYNYCVLFVHWKWRKINNIHKYLWHTYYTNNAF